MAGLRGADILKHLLSEHGQTAADLSRILGGSRNLGAMILRGDRNLTLPHVRKLAAYFQVGAELFVACSLAKGKVRMGGY